MASVDTAKALERCVAALNAFEPAPDFVVISGDLADTPNMEEYDYLKRLLAPLKLPFAGIPGNHDCRELMRAAFPNAPYAFSSGALNQKIEVGELDLLLLDFSVPGKPHGLLEPPTLQWLEQTLHRRQAGRRCCSCIIRPSSPASGTWIARTCAMRPNLPTIVRRHPRVRIVATGHLHRAIADDVCGRALHDLSGAEPCGRSRSRAAARSRRSGSSSRPSICTPGLRMKALGTGDPSGADRRVRRAASVLRCRTASCCERRVFGQLVELAIGLRRLLQEALLLLLSSGSERRRLHALLLQFVRERFASRAVIELSERSLRLAQIA